MDSADSQDIVYYCPDCAVGLRRLRYLTYFTWHQHQLITVPNFPAWVCDVCRARTFDFRALTMLKTMLDSSTPRKQPRPSRNFGAKPPLF